MYKRICSVIVLFVGLLFISDIARAATPFYEGKTIRMVVGLTAGGGFDLYARTIARHMSKHIPGNPTIVVENMTGAGGLIAHNYVYRIAKPNGLTIGHSLGSLFLNQVFDQPGVEFDARKFVHLGAAVTEDCAYAFTKASGITSIEKWMNSKTPVKMGGSGPGSGPDTLINVASAALNLPTHLVTGYKGSADIRLAAETGENSRKRLELVLHAGGMAEGIGNGRCGYCYAGSPQTVSGPPQCSPGNQSCQD